MKILINTASTLKGGGIQVATSFIEDCRQHPENEYHVVLGFMLAKSIKKEQFPTNFFFYEIGYRPATRVFSFKSHDGFFKKLEKKIQPDVVFTTTGPAYWRPLAPHVIGYNLPHHVYPESPYLRRIPLVRKIRWKMKRLIVRYFFRKDADFIVVQTDDVNRRLKKFLHRDHILTVSNTYNSVFDAPPAAAPKLPPKKEGAFRLLTISAWYPHKNLDVIPKVIDCLPGPDKENIFFVVTLPDGIFQREVPAAYHNNIINVGPVKLGEAPALYQECDAMFLPTLLECFSASYAEAMVMQKPIITSDMGFAHTVCDTAAVYINPIDARAIAEKIVALKNDTALQQELVTRGTQRLSYFGSSAKRTEEYLAACKKAMNARRN